MSSFKTFSEPSSPVTSAKTISMVAIATPSPSSCKVTKTSSSASKKKSTSLPAETVDYLKAWMMSPEHIAHPYPTEQEKAQIMVETGIELKQLTNWFVNNRKRYWKPRVEARIQQQVQLPVAPGTAASLTSDLPLKRKSSSQQLAPFDLTEGSNTLPVALSRQGSATVSVKGEGFKFARTSSQEQFRSSSVGQHQQEQVVVSDSSSSGSCASDTASILSSGNEDELANFDSSEDVIADGFVARTETVDVHMLRPLNGVKPTIADVSILATVPSERILCTYENVMLTYRFTVDSIQDRKKVRIWGCDYDCHNFALNYRLSQFHVSPVVSKFRSRTDATLR
jgi:Homeobox KN domain